MLDSKKLLEMAKKRGVVLMEDSLEKGAQGMAHLAVDILEELVSQTETPMDDVVLAAIKSTVRDMADKIEVKL